VVADRALVESYRGDATAAEDAATAIDGAVLADAALWSSVIAPLL